MKEKISVIVPVYNVENYIDKMMESVCGQTHENLEILLIDDGSTDGSAAKCDAWAAKDARVKVHHKENGGVSSARNTGIDQAGGDYIMFVDADDWIEPDMAEILYTQAKASGADVVACELREEFETESESPEVKATDVAENQHGTGQVAANVQTVAKIDTFSTKAESGLALLKPWSPYCKLYRRTLLEHIRFKEYKIAEDLLFNTDVICDTELSKLVYVHQKLYHYLIRKDSAMKQKYQKKYLEGMYIGGMCYDRLVPLSEEYKELNLVGCGVSLVFEKYAALSKEEQKAFREDYKLCKDYAKKYKKALLSGSSLHGKISGALKVYLPDLYLKTLEKRFRA